MIIIMGKSCSGKDSVVKALTGIGYKKVVTYTTRPKRRGEVDGETYHFISNEEFAEKIGSGFFIEYKAYDTIEGRWYYGTSKDSCKSSGLKDVVVLTPDGILDIMKSTEFEGSKLYVVYIHADDVTLLRRLEARGDKMEEATRRFSQDKLDFSIISKIPHKRILNAGRSIEDVATEIDQWYTTAVKQEG